MRFARAGGIFLGVLGAVAATVACGARSGLLLESSAWAPIDGSPGEEGGTPVDAPSSDDVPGIDAQPLDVVTPSACADASDTLIYTVTEQNTLLKFNPSSAQFTRIGALNCPDPYGRQPFSMAVNRQGNAYVLYYAPAQTAQPPAGNIFKVNLNNASCRSTSYVPGQLGFQGFGMGFSADVKGSGETLFVASGDTAPAELGAINETSLVLSVVGTLPTRVVRAELTGTGDGRLFAFYAGAGSTGSVIGQVNKTTAAIVAEQVLPQVTQGGGWAFAFWGGDFYTFTSPGSQGTLVQRYRPSDGTVLQVATYPEIIDGAGVSTCAPVQ